MAVYQHPDVEKILLVGDVHGNEFFARNCVDKAVLEHVDVIIQVGDFGYWEHTQSGRNFLDGLEKRLVEARGVRPGLEWWFLDGNHENHDMLAELSRDDRGLGEVRDHIFHIPRGWRCRFGEYEWGFVGGAFSIDYQRRTKGISIWDQEQTTLADIDALGRARLDVLCAHDVFAGVDLDVVCPFRFNLNARDEAHANETRILLADAVAATKPSRYFHGHWHNAYEYQMGKVSVCGLGAENLQLGTRVVAPDGNRV